MTKFSKACPKGRARYYLRRSADAGSVPCSTTTQDTATLWSPQVVAVFLCHEVSGGVGEFTRKSHRSGVSHNAQFRPGLLVVLPDEPPVGAKNHFHILVSELGGDIPWVLSGGQKG